MQHLPTVEEQNWLVQALAGLVANRGHAHLVSMPVVEPTRHFFPDPWSFSFSGLDRIVRRLMQYAGLTHLDVRIGTFAGEDDSYPDHEELRRRSTAGLFLGIEGETCAFAFNEESPDDPEYMVGVMSHEVAHAYREFHGLRRVDSSRDEELLTDVTAVYLGFGVLVANNSDRYRTSGWIEGNLSYQAWSTQKVGYLTPQAFAYLLALQMVARDLSFGKRHRLLKHMEANQASFVRSAVRSVQEWSHELPRRLNLPPHGLGDSPVPVEAILQPLPELREPPEEAASVDEVPTRYNAGRPVFRLKEHRMYEWGILSLLGGVVVGSPIAATFEQFWPLLLSVCLAIAFGLWCERRRRHDVCSDSDCGCVLESDVTACPGCGGTIAGSIRHRTERFQAEEEYEDQLARARPYRTARKIPRVDADRRKPT